MSEGDSLNGATASIVIALINKGLITLNDNKLDAQEELTSVIGRVKSALRLN